MIKNRTLASAGYGTHIGPLVAAVMATKGIIMEFGMGDYSTTVLHEIARYQDRPLISLEGHKDWLNNFIDLKTPMHQIHHVTNWDEVKIPMGVGVAFVDHAPAERRKVEIERLKDIAQIVVVHDSEKLRYYGYAPVFAKFKYQKEYQRYSKKTMLLSNTIDVGEII